MNAKNTASNADDDCGVVVVVWIKSKWMRIVVRTFIYLKPHPRAICHN